MDDSTIASAEEIIKQQQMQREGVDANIERISQEFLQPDEWDGFRPDDIAEARLQDAAASIDSFIKDEQTHRFQQFLSIATNFSSLSFAQKLHKIPELVESITQLLENMMKEVQEYSDMANELRDLIQYFVRMVMQVKHNVNMMLPLLQAAKLQMGIVQDVLSTDPGKTLDEVDKKDIQLALNRMSSGIQGLLSLAKSATTESQSLDDRIHVMTNSVQSKKVIVEERLEIANFCFKYAVPAGSITSGVAVGGLVAAESFGGVGTLVIAGTAFPPVAAIIGACFMGGFSAATAILLVKKFWVRHQLKALSYLEQIFKGLIELSSANKHFMGYMNDAEEKANTVSQHIQDIQLCLESERQRRANRNVCNVAIDSTTAMIESLERISTLDISKWTDSSNVISFLKTKTMTLAITN